MSQLLLVDWQGSHLYLHKHSKINMDAKGCNKLHSASTSIVVLMDLEPYLGILQVLQAAAVETGGKYLCLHSMLMQRLEQAEVFLHWTAVDPRRCPPLLPCPGLGTPHESLQHLHTNEQCTELTPYKGDRAFEPSCKPHVIPTQKMHGTSELAYK